MAKSMRPNLQMSGILWTKNFSPFLSRIRDVVNVANKTKTGAKNIFSAFRHILWKFRNEAQGNSFSHTSMALWLFSMVALFIVILIKF